MNMAAFHRIGICLLALGTIPAASIAQQSASPPGLPAPSQEAAASAFPRQPSYSPYAGRSYPTRPYFGDTHLHTAFSMDAGAFGARLGPREAYIFAKNNVVLGDAEIAAMGRTGQIPADDYRDQEFAGAAFDPTGHTLFVNVQTPGLTMAIRGPWAVGNL